MRHAYALARLWYAWWRPARRTVAVAAWHDGRVLTVAHSYKSGRTLPGGGLRHGEAPERGAARELREETGLRVAPAALTLVAVTEFDTRYGRRTNWLYSVDLADRPRVRANGWETIDVALTDPAKLPFLARRGAGRRPRPADAWPGRRLASG